MNCRRRRACLVCGVRFYCDRVSGHSGICERWQERCSGIWPHYAKK